MYLSHVHDKCIESITSKYIHSCCPFIVFPKPTLYNIYPTYTNLLAPKHSPVTCIMSYDITYPCDIHIY